MFEYKNYAAQTEGDTAPPMKTLTLDALEFIRRFAQHVLPQAFQKTRYYGIYATANHARLVSKILQSIGKAIWKTTLRTVCQIIMQATGQNPNLCPCCGAQELVIALIPPVKGPLTIEKTQDIIKIVRPPPQATKTDTF